MSQGLTNILVDSIQFWKVISISKKFNYFYNQAAVNFIVGWNELISFINSFSESSPPSQLKKYIVNVPPPNTRLLKMLFSKAAIKMANFGTNFGANFVRIAVPQICF